MIRVSKMADYAVVVLAALTKSRDLKSGAVLAKQTRLPEPTVAKILKLLSKADIVVSVRGVNGGYKLSRAPVDIPVAQIISAIDGPISLTACVDGESCDLERLCMVKGRWDEVNLAMQEALENVTLADMVRNPFMARGEEKDLYEQYL